MLPKVFQNKTKHSDKIGELIKWRQYMDKLNHEQVLKHANFMLKLLTIKQLKSVLFSGLLKCVEDIEYDHIFEMQRNLISDDILNNEKQKNNSKEKKRMNDKNEEKKIVLENKISWLDMVPNDIILNNVCSCLWMKDIFNFSKCGRRYAIMCHSPLAMSNFQLCIKGKDICSYENYFNSHRTDHHQLLGVQYLTVDFFKIYDELYVPYFLKNFFQQLKHVQHLKIIRYLMENYFEQFAQPCFQELKSISFVSSYVSIEDLCWILGNDETRLDEKKEQDIFNSDIIYNLETIAFTDCSFSENTFPYLYELLLPSKINKLSVLKLQNVNYRINTSEKKVLEDENRIRGSLCNLKAFAANVCDNQWNLGDILSRKILYVLQFQLECIHIHCQPYDPPTINNFPFQFLVQNSEFYESRKPKEILHLKELCISFPNSTKTNDEILKKICENLLEDIFLTHVPNKNTGGLQKLCLTFPSIDIANVFVSNPLKTILRKSTSLKFLQLKIEECTKNQKDILSFLKYLCSAFSGITKEPSESAFVFKVQYPECYIFNSPFEFPRQMSDLVDSYLLSFPNGIFQWKFSAHEMYYEARTIIKTQMICLSNNSCFSIMNIKAYESFIAYDTNLMCDCEKCKVNSPWCNAPSKLIRVIH